VGRYGRREVLDRRQAGGGATVKRKHINRELNFSPAAR